MFIFALRSRFSSPKAVYVCFCTVFCKWNEQQRVRSNIQNQFFTHILLSLNELNDIKHICCYTTQNQYILNSAYFAECIKEALINIFSASAPRVLLDLQQKWQKTKTKGFRRHKWWGQTAALSRCTDLDQDRTGWSLTLTHSPEQWAQDN